MIAPTSADPEPGAMRILLIHRYFWPDSPPYASMLRVIARHFSAQGHEVTVLTTQPSYTKETSNWKRPHVEELDGFRVVRKWMFPESKSNWLARIANVAVFFFHVMAHILLRGKRYDLVTASTMPPVVIGAAACAATRLRRGRFVYHCMDLYPEVAELAGSRWLGKGPLRAALRWIDKRTCRKAWRVLVLSEDMQVALVARGLEPGNIRVLNNFALESEDVPSSGVLGPDRGRFRVLFAGNLGRFQGLETVLEAAALLPEDAEIDFHFLGDGAARCSLEEQAGAQIGQRVHFHGFRPLADALGAMREAHLGIVSLQPGIVRVAYPSKTMTYLAAGLPVLAMVEQTSELARTVEQEGVGFAVEYGDAAGIAQGVLDLAADRGRLAACQRAAQDLAEREFSAEAALARWDRLLDEGEASSDTMVRSRDTDRLA